VKCYQKSVQADRPASPSRPYATASRATRVASAHWRLH
jgi:hypothetical protein